MDIALLELIKIFILIYVAVLFDFWKIENKKVLKDNRMCSNFSS